MAEVNKQRLKLLYLMEIFSKDTDDEHMLTLPQIISKLKAYGVDVERKTLYQDFEILRDYGFDIVGVQTQRNYYYHIGNRQFELPELKLLVDSVQSAKFMTKKKSNALIKKLECWIMALDEGVRIVGPEKVLERMKEKIKVLNNLYKS